jgi:capsular polysaccharide biosynthesis protein
MSNENKPEIFDSGNLLLFITSRLKPLIIIFIISFIGSTIVAYLLPVKYKATTVLFASQNNNLSRSILTDHYYETKDFLAFGEDQNTEQMMQILQSDAVMLSLARRFDLYRHYKLEDAAERYSLLKDEYREHFSFNITEYQSIEVTVNDEDKNMVAVMANAVAEVGDSIYRQILMERANAALRIVKQQFDSATSLYGKLQDSLSFFRQHGILTWDYQIKEYTKGYVEASLKGSPDEEKQMDDRLKPFATWGKEFSQAVGLVHMQEGWLDNLRRAYLLAKVEAAQSVPSLFVADRAVTPDKKSYPIRWLVVLGGVLGSLLFSLFVMLLINRFSGLKKNQG